MNFLSVVLVRDLHNFLQENQNTYSNFFFFLMFEGPEIGGATRMKLIVNMIMGTTMASLAEGMAMAEKVGLDQEDVAEVLSLGSLSCPTVIHKSQGEGQN